MSYDVNGKAGEIVYRWRNGETHLSATVAPEHLTETIEILNRAARKQIQSHYTDSARLYRKAETMPGFQWVNPA